jgi:hypothetical protein
VAEDFELAKELPDWLADAARAAAAAAEDIRAAIAPVAVTIVDTDQVRIHELNRPGAQ